MQLYNTFKWAKEKGSLNRGGRELARPNHFLSIICRLGNRVNFRNHVCLSNWNELDVLGRKLLAS